MDTETDRRTDIEGLRADIGRLAAMDRESASAGEREAAELIAARFREAGAAVTVEAEQVHGTYWWPLGIPAAAGIVAARLGRRHRLLGGVLGGAAAFSVVDDLAAGRRWLRRALPGRRTANVVAITGDPGAARTLVLVSHHDAAHSGLFFDPRISRFLGRVFPTPDDAVPSQIPVMAPIAVAPAVAALASLVGWRKAANLAAVACAGIIASFTDIALRRTVPGANDNLSGVATLLAVARRLQQRPLSGLRVVLVSTGAEESLMEGMDAFARRHFPEMDPARTSFLCVDTVGSPHLLLAEAEGMLQMRDYDTDLNELIHSCAQEQGVRLERGFRMRLGTDGYLALRNGFRAAMLMSVDDHGAPSNYHWPTDTADRVDYERVADIVAVCDAAARRMAAA